MEQGGKGEAMKEGGKIASKGRSIEPGGRIEATRREGGGIESGVESKHTFLLLILCCCRVEGDVCAESSGPVAWFWFFFSFSF